MIRMSLQSDVKALARGCDFYRQKYEDVSTQLAKAQSAIEQMKTTGRARGYVTKEDIIASPEFQDFITKIKMQYEQSAPPTDNEREKMNQQSDVLLNSLVKVSSEINLLKEANTALSNENNDLKNQIQAMLSNRINEQQDMFADALKNQDIAYESKSALEKASQLIADLRAENTRLQEYVKYKEMYEKEHEELIRVGNQLDEVMRSGKTASFVDDVDDIFG